MSQLYAGIDMGGTSIKGVLATEGGTIIAQKQILTQSHEGPYVVLKRIAEFVVDLSAESSSNPVAVGIGVPGLVDLHNGVTKFLPNMPSKWKEIPAAEILTKQLNCPVRLLNDVRTATLGELTYGHGKGLDDLSLAFFSLGTGIGGGIALNGKLRLGPVGSAGELGHQTILPNGPLCGCGNHGCLETLASGPAIVAEGVRLLQSGHAPYLYDIVQGDAGKVTTREMTLAAEQDLPIKEVIQQAATYLGIGVSNVITVLHPDLVVLGGGVAEIGNLIFDRVREVISNRVRMFSPESIEIKPSLMGEQAGMMGAVALALGKLT